MRRLALLLLASTACHADSSPTIDASPPDAVHAACPEPAPQGLGCEEEHQNQAACPSLDEICDGVCGAAYECCYCDDHGEWAVEVSDCPPCVDAGP